MGFSNVRKPERGQTELPDVCLQQDAWFKVNADAWKHCVICLVDAEQSLVFFQKSADNDVDIKVRGAGGEDKEQLQSKTT
mmetsp:Transcript_6022/g.10735  ORF Transcript_6022/g.10735 Transcript_6022/m.10735 type:complete len:80 (-) Transcript_6022:2391-2630(-)